MSFSHQRFYASIVPARAECPACGTLIGFGGGVNQPHKKQFDPVTSRLKCPNPHCGRRYYVGMLLWDAGKRRSAPYDTLPNRRILAQLRAYTGGFWPADAPTHDDHVLVHAYVAAECACAPAAWSALCPVHGGQGELDTTSHF